MSFGDDRIEPRHRLSAVDWPSLVPRDIAAARSGGICGARGFADLRSGPYAHICVMGIGGAQYHGRCAIGHG